jgi:hypothetical protein
MHAFAWSAAMHLCHGPWTQRWLPPEFWRWRAAGQKTNGENLWTLTRPRVADDGEMTEQRPSCGGSTSFSTRSEEGCNRFYTMARQQRAKATTLAGQSAAAALWQELGHGIPWLLGTETRSDAATLEIGRNMVGGPGFYRGEASGHKGERLAAATKHGWQSLEVAGRWR